MVGVSGVFGGFAPSHVEAEFIIVRVNAMIQLQGLVESTVKVPQPIRTSAIIIHVLVSIYIILTFTFVAKRTCLVDGAWGSWSFWSPCSASCGPHNHGKRFRTRQCNDPSPDFGGKFCLDRSTAKEEEACNRKRCPSEIVNFSVKCNYLRFPLFSSWRMVTLGILDLLH